MSAKRKRPIHETHEVDDSEEVKLMLEEAQSSGMTNLSRTDRTRQSGYMYMKYIELPDAVKKQYKEDNFPEAGQVWEALRHMAVMDKEDQYCVLLTGIRKIGKDGSLTPLSLDSIMNKLLDGKYKSSLQVTEDVVRLIQNCKSTCVRSLGSRLRTKDAVRDLQTNLNNRLVEYHKAIEITKNRLAGAKAKALKKTEADDDDDFIASSSSDEEDDDNEDEDEDQVEKLKAEVEKLTKEKAKLSEDMKLVKTRIQVVTNTLNEML